MHERNSERGRIPSLDLRRRKSVLGVSPRVFFGGLVLIAILLIYLLLIVHHSFWLPVHPKPVPTSSYTPQSAVRAA